MPEDFAFAALYLASDESRHTIGHNLMVDAVITVGMASYSDLVAGREKRVNRIEGE